MTTVSAEEKSLQYPIGFARKADSFTLQERNAAIEGLRVLPEKLRAAVHGFSESQLETPYRPGGWTVRQLVHHVADSHMNAYSRSRHGATGDYPTIFAYEEARWAELEDARTMDIGLSLDLLKMLHARWVVFFASLDEDHWKRGYTHPENGRQSLEQALIIYDWHGRHHTAHITQLSARMGW